MAEQARTVEMQGVTRRERADGVGARVREARLDAGLTQGELGGSRFSKEYVSQVELGKTRPSPAALDWFAERLRVDRLALAGESSAAVRAACEAAVARAEAEIERHRHAEALAQLDTAGGALRPGADQRLSLRLHLARGWALQNLGRMEEALVELGEARQAAEQAGSSDAVALALYRIGVVRYKMGSLATAASLLDEALRACQTTRDPSDALRARIFNARAKIRRRQKDFTAAAEDVEQALELAHALNDDRVLAETYLDASLVAERRNEYTLAREHAERSKTLFERVSDQEYVGKLLNNLGQLRAITGKPEEAVPLLRESFRIAVEQDNRVDAAFAASSLASARMHSGDLEGAIESGNRAIELLSSREEYREEEGNARIVIGRASLALGRIDQAEVSFTAAARCFEAVETVSHLAGAWVALGDVAEVRGDAKRAAELYRQAAEALQDVRW
jgi:HTH-type transcriptional regulator, quorum sensing regulator NprR